VEAGWVEVIVEVMKKGYKENEILWNLGTYAAIIMTESMPLEDFEVYRGILEVVTEDLSNVFEGVKKVAGDQNEEYKVNPYGMIF
jgi:hypothetical protein